MCVHAPAQEGVCAISRLRSATSLQALRSAKKNKLEYQDALEELTSLGDSRKLRFVCNTSRCRLVLRMCVIVARTRDSIKEHL